MDQLVHWVRVDSSGLDRPQLPGDRPVNSMAVPMMLLCLVDQLTEGRAELAEKYRELGDWCVCQILQHVQVCAEHHLYTDAAFHRCSVSMSVYTQTVFYFSVSRFLLLLIREMERPFLRMCRWRERSCQAVRDAYRTQVVHQGLKITFFSTVICVSVCLPLSLSVCLSITDKVCWWTLLQHGSIYTL